MIKLSEVKTENFESSKKKVICHSNGAPISGFLSTQLAA